MFHLIISYPKDGIMYFLTQDEYNIEVTWLNGATRDSVKYFTASIYE